MKNWRGGFQRRHRATRAFPAALGYRRWEEGDLALSKTHPIASIAIAFPLPLGVVLEDWLQATGDEFRKKGDEFRKTGDYKRQETSSERREMISAGQGLKSERQDLDSGEQMYGSRAN